MTKTHNLYLSDASRLVTAKDAANIANALEKALADIPDDSVQEEEPEITASAYEYFSGARKQHLQDLIAFCRAGDFSLSTARRRLYRFSQATSSNFFDFPL